MVTIDLIPVALMFINFIWLCTIGTIIWLVAWYVGAGIVLLRNNTPLTIYDWLVGGVGVTLILYRDTIRGVIAILAMLAMMLAGILRRLASVGVEDKLSSFMWSLVKADYGNVVNSQLQNMENLHAEELATLKKELNKKTEALRIANKKFEEIRSLSRLDSVYKETAKDMQNYLDEKARNGGGNKKDRNSNGKSNGGNDQRNGGNGNGGGKNNRRDYPQDILVKDYENGNGNRNDQRNGNRDNRPERELAPERRDRRNGLPETPQWSGRRFNQIAQDNRRPKEEYAVTFR